MMNAKSLTNLALSLFHLREIALFLPGLSLLAMNITTFSAKNGTDE